jgi:2-methylcitrate dehydratase PrpD
MIEESLQDQDVLSFAARVEIVVDAEFDHMFPKSVPARVVTRAGSNLVEETVLAPLGEPTNPLDWSAVQPSFSASPGRYCQNT